MMLQLLEDWDRIAERLHQAPSVALFLDFDGTLAPLTSDPKGAEMNRAARAALRRLARAPQVHAWIISGRRRDDLESTAGPIPGLTFLGLHGASGVLLSSNVMKTVAEARQVLASRLNGTKGVMIEDKGATFAVHHRSATEPEAGARAACWIRLLQSSGEACASSPATASGRCCRAKFAAKAMRSGGNGAGARPKRFPSTSETTARMKALSPHSPRGSLQGSARRSPRGPGMPCATVPK